MVCDLRWIQQQRWEVDNEFCDKSGVRLWCLTVRFEPDTRASCGTRLQRLGFLLLTIILDKKETQKASSC